MGAYKIPTHAQEKLFLCIQKHNWVRRKISTDSQEKKLPTQNKVVIFEIFLL
jgi:hypothetical protein